MKKLKRVVGSAASYEEMEVCNRVQMIDAVENAITEALDKWGSDINCFNLHLELKSRFSHAKAWGSPDHWLTEISGMLFDRTGLLFIQHETTDRAFKKAFRMPPVNDF